MDNLKEKLKKVIEGYTGKGLNDFAYLTTNSDETLFTVVDIANVRGTQLVETSLIVRLIDSKIVIDYDDNNKPLVDALMQAGIPREQIILAYEGEPVPANV
jgi:hypothetical protein